MRYLAFESLAFVALAQVTLAQTPVERQVGGYTQIILEPTSCATAGPYTGINQFCPCGGPDGAGFCEPGSCDFLYDPCHNSPVQPACSDSQNYFGRIGYPLTEDTGVLCSTLFPNCNWQRIMFSWQCCNCPPGNLNTIGSDWCGVSEAEWNPFCQGCSGPGQALVGDYTTGFFCEMASTTSSVSTSKMSTTTSNSTEETSSTDSTTSVDTISTTDTSTTDTTSTADSTSTSDSSTPTPSSCSDDNNSKRQACTVDCTLGALAVPAADVIPCGANAGGSCPAATWCTPALQVQDTCTNDGHCKFNNRAMNMLKRIEKGCPYVYGILSTGKHKRMHYTIGWGHDCTSNDDCHKFMPKYNYDNKPRMPYLQSAGDAQLEIDLGQVEEKIAGWINSQYLNSNQFSALVDYGYNAGRGSVANHFQSAIEQYDPPNLPPGLPVTTGDGIPGICEIFATINPKGAQETNSRIYAQMQLCNWPTSQDSGCQL